MTSYLLLVGGLVVGAAIALGLLRSRRGQRDVKSSERVGKGLTGHPPIEDATAPATTLATSEATFATNPGVRRDANGEAAETLEQPPQVACQHETDGRLDVLDERADLLPNEVRPLAAAEEDGELRTTEHPVPDDQSRRTPEDQLAEANHERDPFGARDSVIDTNVGEGLNAPDNPSEAESDSNIENRPRDEHVHLSLEGPLPANAPGAEHPAARVHTHIEETLQPVAERTVPGTDSPHEASLVETETLFPGLPNNELAAQGLALRTGEELISDLTDGSSASAQAETTSEREFKAETGSVELQGEVLPAVVLPGQSHNEHLDLPRAQSQSRAEAAEPDPLTARPDNDAEERTQLGAVRADQPTGFRGQESTIEEKEPLATATANTPDRPGSPESLAVPTPTRTPEERARSPRQYRPTNRAPRVPRIGEPVTREGATRDRAFPVVVRLVFEKAGFCTVTLLPRRGEGMPARVSVSGSGGSSDLVALQDDWYQDVALPTAAVLKDGLEWAGALPEEQRNRWSLGGRAIYVLAPHDELNGFVSVPRLVLGEQHVVLCIAEKLQEVRDAISATGSPEPGILDGDSGLPTGWVGLHPVIPHKPIVGGDPNILDALRPLPDIEVALDNGIRIERQTWLNGFPPHIRLRGDTSTVGDVLIDGQIACLTPEGSYQVSGWDAVGDHHVWCAAATRTYAIRDGLETWESWDAYKWTQGEVIHGDVETRPSVCGVLIRPPSVAHTSARAIVVPASNPVLIGATPGEITFCGRRADIRGDVCVGFPSFEPVWALPSDPLHCDKRVVRVLLIGAPLVATSIAGSTKASNITSWCTAIRMARRKGLFVDPPSGGVADLWKIYSERAKAIWRSVR